MDCMTFALAGLLFWLFMAFASGRSVLWYILVLWKVMENSAEGDCEVYFCN